MPETFADNIKQIRQETGARLVAVGEAHDEAGTIQYMRDSMPALKAQGISTLYIELPADRQALIDKALKGDEKSQRDLRLDFEANFGRRGSDDGSKEAAQQHYDLLFDANKAGIRVKCVDANDQNFSMMYETDLKQNNGTGESRLAISNPVITRNIKQADDGKGAIMLVGADHLYRVSEDPHPRAATPKEFISHHGGLEQMLDAKGIAATRLIIERSDTQQTFKIEKAVGTNPDYAQSGYVLNAPTSTGSERSPHISAAFRTYWNRLANDLETAGVQNETYGQKDLTATANKLAAQTRQLSERLDNPEFLKLDTKSQESIFSKDLNNLENGINDFTTTMSDRIEEKKIQGTHEYVAVGNSTQAVSFNENERNDVISRLVHDNQDLHLSGAAKMWKRDPMPLAGEKTGLAKNFDQALTAKTPLNRPDQPLPQATAPAMTVRSYER